jgi:hypothetical protein
MIDAQSNFDLDDLVNCLCDTARGEAPGPTIKDILQGAVEDPRHMRDGCQRLRKMTPSCSKTNPFQSGTVALGPARPRRLTITRCQRSSASTKERNDFFDNDLQRGIRKCSEIESAAGNVLEIGSSAIHAVECE